MGSTVKVIPVKNRLGMMLHARGGIARDDAVSAAGQNVETLRSVFIKAIPREVAALEAMLNATGRTTITKDELEAMLRRAGQILTLSGTFGFSMLDDVVKRFCDLAMGMIDKNIEHLARIADRHYIIERGKAVWSGTSEELIAEPDLQHRYLGV